MKFLGKLTSAVVCGFYAMSAMAITLPDGSVCGEQGFPDCALPEPSSLWLVGLGLAGAVLVARFFKK